jgi:cysteinyl-tRNA synthetase
MARKVLVLNQDYTAFTICSATKAFLLVYMNKAEMVTEDGRVKLRSITRSFPMPSIIRLNRYVNKPFRQGGVVLNRQNVFKRDKIVGSNKEALIKGLLSLYASFKEKREYDKVDEIRASFKAMGLLVKDMKNRIDWAYEE